MYGWHAAVRAVHAQEASMPARMGQLQRVKGGDRACVMSRPCCSVSLSTLRHLHCKRSRKDRGIVVGDRCRKPSSAQIKSRHLHAARQARVARPKWPLEARGVHQQHDRWPQVAATDLLSPWPCCMGSPTVPSPQAPLPASAGRTAAARACMSRQRCTRCPAPVERQEGCRSTSASLSVLCFMRALQTPRCFWDAAAAGIITGAVTTVAGMQALSYTASCFDLP